MWITFYCGSYRSIDITIIKIVNGFFRVDMKSLSIIVTFMIKIKTEGLEDLFSDLPDVTRKATAQALNVVARKVNKNLRKSISERYNIPKSATKFGDLVSLIRANARGNVGKAVLVIKKEGRGLIKYGAVQVKSGISVVVKKSAKTIKGGFISSLRSGESEKFAFAKAKGKKAGIITRRTKKGTPYKADKREILYGPQIAQLYTNDAAEKIILETIDAEFETEIQKQFNAQFEKKGRRR
jgi:hypothetical protein